MSVDLTDRLSAMFVGLVNHVDRSLFGEARDEIVRLRAENERRKHEAGLVFDDSTRIARERNEANARADKAEAERDRLRDEVERLQDRLEMRHAWQVVDGKEVRITVEPGSIPDGIDARDETIRQLDKNCDTLRSERDRLRDALRDKP
jgi:predicted nuclease with TOPRIM domain